MTDQPPPAFDELLPPQMAARAEAVGVAKVTMPLLTTAALAVLAGAFIALGANFYTVATTGSDLGFGPTRVLGGTAFSLGLLLVVAGGAELFTGNNLIVMAWANRKVSTPALLRNWAIVYAGNFAGAIGTAAIVYLGDQWAFGTNRVGENALRIADGKVQHGFVEAVALGALCNALVCLAVWLSFSARSTIDKAVAVILPITAFVTAGFEHSIANMYFIPLGLFLKHQDALTGMDSMAGTDLSELTWQRFLVDNLLPVTIGNIIGGALLVGAVYWFVYLRPARTSDA